MSRDWPFPRIFAHRGGGTLAPENTLAAIRLGQSLGYSAHELDVKLSLDDRAVLMHDATLERTTNGIGRAAEMQSDAGGLVFGLGGWMFAQEMLDPDLPGFGPYGVGLRRRPPAPLHHCAMLGDDVEVGRGQVGEELVKRPAADDSHRSP